MLLSWTLVFEMIMDNLSSRSTFVPLPQNKDHMPNLGGIKGKHKIPEDKWTEIYSLYEAGSTAAQIYKKVTEEWHIATSERSVQRLIEQLRAVKIEHLSQLI